MLPAQECHCSTGSHTWVWAAAARAPSFLPELTLGAQDLFDSGTSLQSLEHPQWVYIWVGCLSALDPCFDVREQWLDFDCSHSSSDLLDRIARLLLAARQVPVGTKLSNLLLKCFIFPQDTIHVCCFPLISHRCAGSTSSCKVRTHFTHFCFSTQCFWRLFPCRKKIIRLIFPSSPPCCFTTGVSFQQLFPQPKKWNFTAFSSILSEDVIFFFFLPSRFSPIKWHFLGG